MDLVVHENRAAQARALAVAVATELNVALAAEGRASLAVPGGSTPKAFLAALAAQPVDWSAVAVMATDERWTAPDDPRSNEAMIRAAMESAGAASLKFLGFWRAGETPAAAAHALSEAVAPLAPLTSVVMGMGDDMHCASLFPGGEGLETALDVACGAFVAPMVPPGGLEPRVTLTLPALAGARSLRLLIAGEAKRAALDAALKEGDALKAPVAAVLRNAGRVEAHWAP